MLRVPAVTLTFPALPLLPETVPPRIPVSNWAVEPSPVIDSAPLTLTDRLPPFPTPVISDAMPFSDELTEAVVMSLVRSPPTLTATSPAVPAPKVVVPRDAPASTVAELLTDTTIAPPAPLPEVLLVNAAPPVRLSWPVATESCPDAPAARVPTVTVLLSAVTLPPEAVASAMAAPAPSDCATAWILVPPLNA